MTLNEEVALRKEIERLQAELATIRPGYDEALKIIERQAAWIADKETLASTVVSLREELEQAKDDLLRLDGACWYCLNPEVEDAWRHEHGDKGPHWHHCLDPGDGLADDCAHSELLERVFQEGMKAALQSVPPKEQS